MKKLHKIMLIDDDAITNFLNELLIKEMEIADEMIIASNGQEALDVLAAQNLEGFCPELILLDINMPVMNGFDFLEKFDKLDFENKQSVIVIMLTTSLNPGDSKKAKQLNVTDYLSKPLTKEGLNGISEKYFH
jgi:CheY-like chemotaxis protein